MSLQTSQDISAQQTDFAIKVVDNKSDWNAFVDFPYVLYVNDPVWVPQLRVAVKELLNVNKNPFFKHAYMRAFIAMKQGKVIGRIAGIIDHTHNDFHKEKTAFFGFFECANDIAVARGLFDVVKEWAKEWGMDKLRGPCSPSTNHECGLLIEGFQDPPTINTVYNPPYYQKLLEDNGFGKAMDLLSYHVTEKAKWDDRLIKHAERVRTRSNITFREFNPKKFTEEAQILAEIYNDAWESNWGFVPMNREEFAYMAKEMKPLLDPTIFYFAEVNGKPAGFGMTLPDVNQVFIKIRDGKLFPFGIFKLLWNLKGPGRKKAITRTRLLTLGIRKEFRHLALGPLFYIEFGRRIPKKYPYTEASWILENNKPMNNAMLAMGATITKRHRIFDCALI